MSGPVIDQQEHGYRSGHQLLAATLKLPRPDQDLVDRMSDIAGPLRPGETFEPYLTCYPLPSGTHFVIARTWQDLDAPRAGCVLTRSLLVPMRDWSALDDVARLLPLLVPVVPGEPQFNEIPLHAPALPPVYDPCGVELAEALFLETRKPIVVFDAPKPEAMTVRVLSALWPGLRRRFAVCAFALSPRKIEGRDFDLAFAPRSARTRFSEWPGRRIDANSQVRARHRWSEVLAKMVFESNRPGFSDIDTFGLLREDGDADEAPLRLALLWNELEGKAKTTPTAVLGMLDILNSQGETGRYAQLVDPIIHAIEESVRRSPDKDAWQFLYALVGKFQNHAPPKRVLTSVRQSATALTRKSARGALDFVRMAGVNRRLPAVLVAGFADGLVEPSGLRIEAYEFADLPADLALQMIALSGSFTKMAVGLARTTPTDWIPPLVRAVSDKDRALQRKARRRIVPTLDQRSLSPLLPPLLTDVTGQELATIAVRIGKQTKFAWPDFDDPLLAAARDASSITVLRDAVASKLHGPGPERFLLSSLRLDAADISWLTKGAADRNLAQKMLVKLLESETDRAVQAIQRDRNTREAILDLLMVDVGTGANQVVRVLMLGDGEIASVLQIGCAVRESLGAKQRNIFDVFLLERALERAPLHDEHLPGLLSAAGELISPQDLVRMATPWTASTGRIAGNLILLNTAPDAVRRGVLRNVAELSERIIGRSREDLGEAAYIAWAALIGDAGRDWPETQLRAALATLPFALEETKLPVSALILKCFPVVYEQLLNSRGDEDFALIPALMSLPWRYFVDWDRAKEARRDLTDSFLRSNWPPANLLLTAMDAGIGGKILRRVSRAYRGNEYIAAIERDGERLKPTQRKRVQSALAEFRSNRPRDNWD